MAKTEDIEGRLAAYIDGELDANQRAEIEKHLAEHPKHRVLIRELMAQKDLVKALPRQPAPGDLAEAFTAQLERAVLLGDVDSSASRPPMRIGFFQQFRTVAAVLILTAGLAALIFMMLPRNDGNSPLADLRSLPAPSENTVSFDREPAPLPSPAGTALRAADSPAISLSTFPPATNRSLSDAPIARGDVTPAVANEPSAPTEIASAVAPGGPAVNNPSSLTERDNQPYVFNNGGVVGADPFRQIAADQMRLDPTPPSGEVVAVLRTNDIQVANQQVTDYLSSNNIHWEVQPMPAPLGLRQEQTAMASRLQSQTGELEKATTAPVMIADESAGRGRGGSGGGRGGAGANPSIQFSTNQWLTSNSKMAGAAGDNVLVQDVGPQRIIARQVSRRQADQVLSHVNQMQSQVAMAKDADRQLGRANTIAVAPGFNSFGQSPPLVEQSPMRTEELRSDGIVSKSAIPTEPVVPTTFPSSLHLVPSDPFSFFAASKQSGLTILQPTTQPANYRFTTNQAPIVDQQPDQLVDLVIMLEPESGAAQTPTTEPAAAPVP